MLRRPRQALRDFGHSRPLGSHSALYSLPNSPLQTVFEAAAPQQDQDSSENWEKLENNSLELHSNFPRGRHQAGRARLQQHFKQTPSALLHNDWYLNQLFKEVHDLYKPGTLTGFPLHSRLDIADRPLTLLRDIAPGCRIQPLTTSATGSQTGLRYSITNQHPQLHSEVVCPPMPPKRKNAGSAAARGGKRNPAGGRRNLYDDEDHVFSAKSKLVNEDLVQFFASPEAWTSLSAEEQEVIRSLLPPDIPYDETGAPAQTYLRYDNDWRNQVRLFTEDLEAGRYEPEWIAEAEEASEARRRGDYDGWKEDQFEEHWGQKSDAHADLMAGQAMKLRLGELIGAGVFRVGDVFDYERVFGSGKNAYMVHKESTITDIIGNTLTFTMPPGMQLKPQSNISVSPAISNITDQQRRSVFADIKSGFSDNVKAVASEQQGSESGELPHLSEPSKSVTSGHENEDSEITKKPNRKRFGIFGSLRRSSSADTESTVNQPTSSRFSLKRKPVSDLMIVPNPPGTNLELLADYSSLSELSDLSETEIGSDPFAQERSLKRKPVPSSTDNEDDGFSEEERDTITVTRKFGALPRRPIHFSFEGDQSADLTVPKASQPGSKRPSTHDSDGSFEPANDRSKKALRPAKHAKKSGKGPLNGNQSTGTIDESSMFDAEAARAAGLIVVRGVDSLHMLEQKLLEVDGRRKGEPRANAWRTFRCLRDQKDMGTLADIREEYYKMKYG